MTTIHQRYSSRSIDAKEGENLLESRNRKDKSLKNLDASKIINESPPTSTAPLKNRVKRSFLQSLIHFFRKIFCCFREKKGDKPEVYQAKMENFLSKPEDHALFVQDAKKTFQGKEINITLMPVVDVHGIKSSIVMPAVFVADLGRVKIKLNGKFLPNDNKSIKNLEKSLEKIQKAIGKSETVALSRYMSQATVAYLFTKLSLDFFKKENSSLKETGAILFDIQTKSNEVILVVSQQYAKRKFQNKRREDGSESEEVEQIQTGEFLNLEITCRISKIELLRLGTTSLNDLKNQDIDSVQAEFTYQISKN